MIDNKKVFRVCPNCKRRSIDIHETICVNCGYVTREEKQVITKDFGSKGMTNSETALD